MLKEDLLSLINEDIDAAFIQLDAIFGKSNATYKDLSDEFISPPNNFSLKNFRSRLLRFVNTEYDDSEEVSTQDSELTYYKALCELDFKQQTDYFKSIYQYKKIPAFLIHGKGENEESDLRWLYNQILYTEGLLKERCMFIDCESKLGATFERFMDELYQKFEINNTIPGNKPIAVLRNAIQDRLKNGSFVCIIQNATKFLWNEAELCKMFDQFLKYLDEEIVLVKSKHRFILLFVDAAASGYKSQFKNYFFWYDETTAKTYSHAAYTCKEMKIFDLSPVGKVVEKDISDWIGFNQKNFPAFYPQIEGYVGKEDTFLKDGDSPFQVIKQICEALKINFDNKWIN